MTGTGSYNADTDRFVLEVSTTGRWKCNLKYVRSGERINITGKCDGKPVNDNHNDKDQDKHKAPRS
jgi:hypothetical protein